MVRPIGRTGHVAHPRRKGPITGLVIQMRRSPPGSWVAELVAGNANVLHRSVAPDPEVAIAQVEAVTARNGWRLGTTAVNDARWEVRNQRATIELEAEQARLFERRSAAQRSRRAHAPPSQAGKRRGRPRAT